MQWVEEIGGHEQLNEKLLKRKKGEELPTFIPPKVFSFSGHITGLRCTEISLS